MLLKRENKRTNDTSVGFTTCAVMRTTDGSHPFALNTSVSELVIDIKPSILTGGIGVYGVDNAWVAVGVKNKVDVVSTVGMAVLLISVGVEVNVRVGVTGVGVGSGVAVSVCVGAGVDVACGANVPNEQAREKKRRSVSKINFLIVVIL